MNVELDWFEKHAMKRPCVWEKAPEEKPAPKTTSTQWGCGFRLHPEEPRRRGIGSSEELGGAGWSRPINECRRGKQPVRRK